MDTGSSSQELVLDYSQLSEIYLKEVQLSDRDKLEAEFKQKIGILMAEIERTAPNLKALDQYEALQTKEKEVSEKFEAARKEEREVADKYNSVKQRRYCPIIFVSSYGTVYLLLYFQCKCMLIELWSFDWMIGI